MLTLFLWPPKNVIEQGYKRINFITKHLTKCKIAHNIKAKCETFDKPVTDLNYLGETKTTHALT